MLFQRAFQGDVNFDSLVASRHSANHIFHTNRPFTLIRITDQARNFFESSALEKSVFECAVLQLYGTLKA